MKLNDRVRYPALVTVILAASGLACLVFQNEDDTPVLAYFTVWSAVLVLAYWALAATLPNRKWLDSFAVASGACITFSGTVFLAAIAPVNGFGEQGALFFANFILHAALPLAALLALRRLNQQFTEVRILWTLAPPVLYALGTFAGQAWFASRSPYSFLDRDNVGALGVAIAIGAGTVLYLCFAWGTRRYASA